MSAETLRQGEPPEDIELREGQTIESIGRRWAQEARERLGFRKNAILIIRDTKEYDRWRRLPTFTGENDPQPRKPRFDEEGNVYIPVNRVKVPQEDIGRRYITTEEYGYEVLNRERVLWTFDNLPKTPTFYEVILNKFDSDIESAIRMQRHVLEGYAPETEATEIELARKVIARTDQIAHQFMGDRMSRDDLLLIARGIGHFLEEEVHLVDPRDPLKRKILDNLLKIDPTDSLGRHNPLVLRTRVRAAYLAATKRVIIGGKIVRKFADNQQVLLFERETTRWALKTALEQLLSVWGHADFNRPDSSATKLQRSAIANILLDISNGHLAQPRVKPYIYTARYAAINLIGVRHFKKDDNRRVLGDTDADDLFSRMPTSSAPATNSSLFFQRRLS